MRKKLLLWLCSLLLIAGFISADWYYNPQTGTIDYYEPTGVIITGSFLTLGLNAALSQERILTAGAGIAFTDTGANGTLTVATNDAAIDHNALLNYVAGEHLVLPSTIAAVLTDHAFTLGVDADATPDYFGVAGGDGLFRFTANHFTMADGVNFVTLSLADHATARTALGLGTANDVQFTDVHHTAFISTVYYNNGNSGGAITIDWNNGNLQYVTLTAAGVDLTFTEPPNPGDCKLWIIQDGTGNRTIDWTHEITPEWPGGVAPTLSTGIGDVDVVVFTFIGGTTYRGLFNGNFTT